MQAAEEGEFVGEKLDAGLRAVRFSSPPSADEFAADVEPKNVPFVFRGVTKGWGAFSRWDPHHGGLDYLLGKLGRDVAVQAMMSNSGHVFYGDIRSHERVPIPFSTFIESCKSYLLHVNAARGSSIEHAMLKEQGCLGETTSSSSDHTEQVYLAQVSILNTESNARCSLEVLKEDIQEPIFLRGKSISSINFWMNRAHMRSSTHYDPHHNLLCVVAGCKKVTLWPPSASPSLYPMPVYGEASNHSSVSIEEPDYSSYTRARYMKEYSERVVLSSGDALFIPEGWYHQVDSDDLTIAVNFWWKSRIMTQMLEHMDAYYLRRILSSFTCLERISLLPFSFLMRQNIVVQRNPFDHSKDRTSVQHMDKALAGVKLLDSHKDSPLQALEPSTLQALYELISLVHEGVSQNKIAEPVSQDPSPSPSPSASNETKMIAGADDSSLLDKDPVAKIILPVEPLELRTMLLTMVHTFPRTLEALVLNMLEPVGAEILTRKFDMMDQQTTSEEQAEFYKTFYSVFEDQYAAMDTLLNAKELFSFQVFQNVLDKYLRVHVDRPS